MAPRHPDHLVVVTDFSTVRGGAAQIAMLQAQLMQARGIKVTVFAGDCGTHVPDGMARVTLGESRLLDQGRLRAMTRGIWNIGARRALARWIGAHDSPGTIYHLHGWHQILSPAVLDALRPVAARVAIHAHDYFLACPNGGLFDFRSGAACALAPMSGACMRCNCDKRSYAQKLWRSARQAVQNHVAAPLLQEATTILLQPRMQRYLTRPVPQRVVTLPNPVAAGPRLAHDPAAHGVFLYVGDIHLYKGVFLLAEAARQAGVALRFAGAGADLERLAARYPEHHFTGWVNQAGIRAMMAAARALIAPSLGPEPFGLAPVEALAAGLPVVMSDSMLLSDSLVGRRACASFPSGDVAALAAVLRQLADDDALVSRMAADAPQAAAEVSLTPEAWGDGLMALYAAMLEPRPRPEGPVSAADPVQAHEADRRKTRKALARA